MVWYSHLFQNFPQFTVIHTVKGFGMVNKAKIDVFLELSCFFDDPADVGNLISGSSVFSKSSLNIWKFSVLSKLGESFCICGCRANIIYFSNLKASSLGKQKGSSVFEHKPQSQQSTL